MKDLIEKLRALPLIGPLLRHRFTKFGSVGFSGTLVNLSMLYLGQEYLFAAIQDHDMRLNVSLGLAIFIATLSNFTWNRLWTWRDRKQQAHKSVPLQLLQYFTASWLAIVIQVVITKLLAGSMHYLIANVTAILVGAAVNYLVNDAWTFGARRERSGKSSA
jgi:dolichol-phosphate mannosyltransferase